ncbi:hypothetical protein [Marinoscillum sp.]|uniref:hypothetical protein n=1 Tax=Marinoscillum sp. TaxID=2024838 RepID=UPI003BAB37A4
MKIIHLLIILFVVLLLDACNANRPEPPDNWVQRVNNKSINKITLAGGIPINCAYTSGRHVLCGAERDSIPESCHAYVTYLDGTPREMWSMSCSFRNDTLIFDDGEFSYFYGTKTKP